MGAPRNITSRPNNTDRLIDLASANRHLKNNRRQRLVVRPPHGLGGDGCALVARTAAPWRRRRLRLRP
jgi:hypothetical protein